MKIINIPSLKKVTFANLAVGDLFIRKDDQELRMKITKTSYVNLITKACGGDETDLFQLVKVEGELRWWIP
jgi:hypothetical protein